MSLRSMARLRVWRWQINGPVYDGGSGNRLVFETWLETCLIPALKPGNLGGD
jgi:hypothetical protein